MTDHLPDLAGKVAFVAKAATPVGAACIAILKEAGATVRTADDIDTQDPDAWAGAFQACLDDAGGLDVLVIPSLGEGSAAISDLSLDDFVSTHRSMAVPAFLAQNQGILAMRTGGRGGAVIHVLPAAARAALDGAAAACSAAAGILFSCKSAALECAKAKDGIVVNAILAGPVEGEPALPYPGETQAVSPEAVAESVLFYATTGAEYMTGMDLPVDNGFLAQ